MAPVREANRRALYVKKHRYPASPTTPLPHALVPKSEPLENPFGPKVLPMQPVRCVTYVPGPDLRVLVDVRGFEPLTPCLQIQKPDLVAEKKHEKK